MPRPKHELIISIRVPVYLYEIKQIEEDCYGETIGMPMSAIMNVLDEYKRGKGHDWLGYDLRYDIRDLTKDSFNHVDWGVNR